VKRSANSIFVVIISCLQRELGKGETKLARAASA